MISSTIYASIKIDEKIMQKYERTEAIKVNEVLFNNIGYVDDTILIASNKVEPQQLGTKLHFGKKNQKGAKYQHPKTLAAEIMSIHHLNMMHDNIRVQGGKFRYLGRTIDELSDTIIEIRSRISNHHIKIELRLLNRINRKTPEIENIIRSRHIMRHDK
jgi:hypothetical protein